jgi:hypothetical protein
VKPAETDSVESTVFRYGTLSAVAAPPLPANPSANPPNFSQLTVMNPRDSRNLNNASSIPTNTAMSLAIFLAAKPVIPPIAAPVPTSNPSCCGSSANWRSDPSTILCLYGRLLRSLWVAAPDDGDHNAPTGDGTTPVAGGCRNNRRPPQRGGGGGPWGERPPLS